MRSSGPVVFVRVLFEAPWLFFDPGFKARNVRFARSRDETSAVELSDMHRSGGNRMISYFVSPISLALFALRLWLGPSSTPAVLLAFIVFLALCHLLFAAIAVKFGHLSVYGGAHVGRTIIVEGRICKVCRFLLSLLLAALLTWWTAR